MNNAADRKDIRVAEKQAKAAEALRLDVIRSILATTPGRAWMWDLLTSCHVFHQPFNTDPLITAFACGEMNVGQRLLADVMVASPESYLQMTREANVRDATAAAQRSSSQNNGRDAEGRDLDNDDYTEHRDGNGNPAFDGYGNEADRH